MVLTKSTMLGLNMPAPDFALEDVITSKTISLNDIKGEKGTLVVFICNHCPYVIHGRREFVKIGHEYQKKGIGVVLINSNDPIQYPDDSTYRMKELALNLEFPFPYLFDNNQDVARAYKAVCTPDIFLFDGNLKSVYRGRLDDSSPGKDIPVTGKDLREAMNCLISNKPINEKQHPSMGCSIKWQQ